MNGFRQNVGNTENGSRRVCLNSSSNQTTVLQILYLIELNKLEKKKGAVRMIAVKCGVNHSQVSRFFKKCIEEGELTESLDFTENGKRKLDWRCKIIQDVRGYLERSGITEGTEEVLNGMIENIDYVQLEKLVKN